METMSNLEHTSFIPIKYFTYCSSERAALQFLASGKVQLNGVNSRFFDISNVHEAFRLLNSGTTTNIFVQLNRLDDENKDSKKS